MSTFSVEQVSKTGNLNANLILPQYKLDLISRYMELNSNNPNLRQDQIAKKLGFQTLLYNDIDMI